MFPILMMVLTGLKIAGEAIGIIKKIQKEREPKVTGKITDRVDAPGSAVVEKFLIGKFPYIEAFYLIDYGGDKRKQIETRHIGGDYSHWEFRIVGEERWWMLRNETIESINWIELVSIK